MTWTDDFTHDYFADATYTLYSAVPTSVAPHALTETGAALIATAPAQAQSGPPYATAIDIVGGHPSPYLLVAGFISADLATGFFAGWEPLAGGLIMQASVGGGGSASNSDATPTWPTPNATLAVTLDASGLFTCSFAGTNLTLAVPGPIMAAFEATPLSPLLYMYAVDSSGSPAVDIVLSEWRVGGGGGPTASPPKQISAGDHRTGVVTRPRRLV